MRTCVCMTVCTRWREIERDGETERSLDKNPNSCSYPENSFRIAFLYFFPPKYYGVEYLTAPFPLLQKLRDLKVRQIHRKKT